MALWRECLLGDVLNLKRGYDLPQGSRSPGQFPVISSSGVTDHHSEAKVKGPGVVTGRYGTLGQVFYVESDFWPLNTSLYVQDFKGNDPRFISYFLRTLNLGSQNAAGAVPGVNRSHLHAMEVRIPAFAVQRHIAGILSAYDELIENNQRRIKILETMARAVYREWFVHFRFPGHDNSAGKPNWEAEGHPEGVSAMEGANQFASRVPSALGDTSTSLGARIPLGWEVTTLGAVTTKIGSGATPRGGKDAYKSEGIHLIRSLNIYDYCFEFSDLVFIDDRQAGELDNVTIEENDILLNITGASVARCALVPSYLLPARVNQHVAIVRADPAKVSPFYLLDAINSDHHKRQLLTLAQGGATREALTKDTIRNFEIALPPRALMKSYATIAGGIHRQRELLLRQIQNLRRTRDLLLPRLLSGQIDVEAIPEGTAA